jgi:hypothetical protein
VPSSLRHTRCNCATASPLAQPAADGQVFVSLVSLNEYSNFHSFTTCGTGIA